MRYLFMLYGDQSAWSSQAAAGHAAEMTVFAPFERRTSTTPLERE